MAIKLGSGGSASQVNEIITLNNTANTVTLADGRVYLKGGVFETNTSTYPLAPSSMQAAGLSFSVATQSPNPTGMTWDGSYFWVTGSGTGWINKYSASGVYQGVRFNVSAQMGTNIADLTWDGSAFWVLSPVYDIALKYNASGVYQNTQFSVANAYTPSGITWDGTYFYVINNASGYDVYKFNASGVSQGVAFSVAAQTTNPSSITWDGTSFWVLSDYSNEVLKYNSSGVYQNVSFSTSPETSPYGIISKGGSDTSLFVTGFALDKVQEYQSAIGISSVANLGGQNYVRIG
tara:strand:- start:290 stop:1162 length:873 start_codon:yes stop_codon:yes gene_type:complete